MYSKPWYASWTIWFGVIQVVAAISGFTVHVLDQQTAYTILVTGLATLGLRIKTVLPITF